MNSIKLFSILASILLLLLVAKESYAVYFESDTVYIYENGERITDSNLIWAADYGYGGFCENGECNIGQQFIPATIYRLKTKDITTFNKFEESGLQEQGVEFHKYLLSNSDYSIVFNPGPSKGGEGCGSPNCIGGRIGDHRTIGFDIKTGVINFDGKNPSANKSQSIPMWNEFLTFIKKLFN